MAWLPVKVTPGFYGIPAAAGSAPECHSALVKVLYIRFPASFFVEKFPGCSKCLSTLCIVEDTEVSDLCLPVESTRREMDGILVPAQ